MTTPTHPFGYARPPNGGPQGMGTMLAWDQMMTKSTVYLLHPEVLRRFKALIELAYAGGVPLGVGTGWRVQPNPPPAGFAKPGNSWHESCPISPATATALAIDTVPNISWDWMQIHSGKYGLRSFRYVNNEPWHLQPVEISTSRKFATKLPALVTWDLPGVDQPLPPIPVPPTPVPPSGGTFTMQLTKTELTPATQAQTRGNGDVYLVQQIAQGMYRQSGNPDLDCGKPDGDYGPRTQTAVRTMQALCGLKQDAMCGPATWAGILNSDGK